MNIACVIALCLTVNPALAKRQLIVDGVKVIDMPKWIVSLRKDDKHFCGGTILSPSLVLSAAHCFKWKFETWVVAGSLDLNTAGAQIRKVIGIKQVANRSFEFNTYANDIVLLKLNQPFIFDGRIGAAELPIKTPQQYGDFEVFGFGRNAQGQRSQHLAKVSISFAACEQTACVVDPYCNFRRNDQFCAGIAGCHGPGACRGDSGGAVVSTGTDIVVGIVSYGPSIRGREIYGR